MLKWGIILTRIYVLFDKLNKEGYSECRRDIEAIIGTMTQQGSVDPAIFNIEDVIKRFINSISICNLPKKICD